MTVATAALSPGRVWWSAVRPATLAASVAPVLAGTAIAVHDGGARPAAGLAALVVAIAIQIGVNFSNDYSDFRRGADTPQRIGPVRAASSGVVPPEHVKWAAVAAFGLAGVIGVGLSLATDWRLLMVGGACLLAAWLYTGGPRPYGYLGLGELFVFVFFGLVATCGTVYVEELHVTTLAVLTGCSLGFLASAILVLNNLRDVDSDAAAGKRTLATRIGRERTRYLLVAIAVATFAMPVIAVLAHAASPTILVTLLAAPLLAVPVRTAFDSVSGPALVGALKRTAAAEVAFSMLLAVGVLA
jgi:1,4-dihydroxy-2-naphthoate polyprenyltransferase